MNISVYLANVLLDHALAVAPYTPPTQVWVALYNVAPTANGGGTEVSGSDYRRVSSTWGPALAEIIANSADIRFPASGSTLANWGTIVAAGLLDASVNGNLLFFGPLSAPVTLSLGTDFKVAASDLTITLQ